MDNSYYYTDNDYALDTTRYSELNLFDSNGRMGRLNYFFYSLIVPTLIFWVFAALAGQVAKFGDMANTMAYVLLAAGIIIALFVLLQLTIQRCHDFNANGILALILVIPFSIIFFWLIQGNNGLNRYGEQPKPASLLLKVGALILLAALISVATFYTLTLLN